MPSADSTFTAASAVPKAKSPMASSNSAGTSNLSSADMVALCGCKGVARAKERSGHEMPRGVFTLSPQIKRSAPSRASQRRPKSTAIDTISGLLWSAPPAVRNGQRDAHASRQPVVDVTCGQAFRVTCERADENA